MKDHYAPKYAADAQGNPVGHGAYGYREGIKLTGKRHTGGFLETRDGGFAPEAAISGRWSATQKRTLGLKSPKRLYVTSSSG